MVHLLPSRECAFVAAFCRNSSSFSFHRVVFVYCYSRGIDTVVIQRIIAHAAILN